MGENDDANEAPAPRRSIAWFIWRFLRLPVFAFLGICVLMMFLETRMVYPIPRVLSDSEAPFAEHSEEVFFESADGTKLQGRYYPIQGEQAVILYCHANGEDAARVDPYLAYLRDTLVASVFCFNYRGYGKSEGKPHERGIVADGLAAQRWLAKQTDRKTEDIVLYGRSLGGGVAVAIAAEQGARGLILHGTFSSLPDVAAAHFRLLPVRWLMRNRYPSVESVRNFDGPVMQFHGTDDEVIPFALGRQLFDAIPGEEKEFIEIAGGTHNEPLPEECFQEMREFLKRLR